MHQNVFPPRLMIPRSFCVSGRVGYKTGNHFKFPQSPSPSKGLLRCLGDARQPISPLFSSLILDQDVGYRSEGSCIVSLWNRQTLLAPG